MGWVRVGILGEVTLDTADGSVALRGGPAGLVGYLAVHAGQSRRLRRDRIAFAMWPDRPESGARRSLNDAVYRLREITRPLGVELLDTTPDELGLAADVTVDVVELGVLASSADPTVRRSALALHRGALLEDLDAPWADDARREAEQAYARLLDLVWNDCRFAGDRPGAVETARRWVAVRPFDEAGHRALLRSLASNGALDEAVTEFDRLCARLADALGAEPTRETLALGDQLRAEREFERRDFVARHPPRLVGRLAERSRLVTLVRRCTEGHGGLALVVGDAGLGKTRLLEEVAAAAGWRGAQVSRGTCDEYDLLSPRGPLIDALTQAVHPSRREVLDDLIEPVWLRQLDALTAPGPAAGDDVTVDIEVVPTIRQALFGLQQIAPQVWLLDDVHWSNDDLWFALDELRQDLATQRALIVVAARRDQLRDRPTWWDLVERWDASGVAVVHVGPLDDDAVAELVADPAVAGPERDTVDTTGIVAAAGGNPLVAIALCGVPAGDRAGASTIADVVHRQLSTIDTADVAAVAAAAVLGDTFDYGLWRAVATDSQLPSRAATLERAGLIMPSGKGYRFTNAATRHAVLERIPPDRIPALHAVALQELERRQPHHVVALLAHAVAAQLRAPTCRYAIEAGVEALRTSRFALAAEHFRRALEVADDDAVVRVALSGLVRALHVLADRDCEHDAIERLELAAEATGDALERAAAHRERSRWQLATGRFSDALGTVHAAERLLDGTAGNAAAELRAALSLDAAAALRALGRMNDAGEAAERALALFRDVGDPLGEATATDLLGGIAWSRADFDLAARRHAAAAERFEQLGAPSRQSRALNNLGSALWGRGDYVSARGAHEEALTLSRALGDRQSESDNLDNLGGVAYALGDHRTAIDHYRAALTIRRETDDAWGVSISLSNLGDTYRALGDPDRALAHFAESIEENERAGVVRNEVTTRQSQGLTLLDAGRPEDALPILVAAAARHDELGDHANRQETLAGIARARLDLGDADGAVAAVRELIERQRPTDRSDLRQVVHLVAAATMARIGDDAAAHAHLGRAAVAMRESLQPLAPEDRRRVTGALPHHRATIAALAEASVRIVVRLAPLAAGRGHVVADDERVAVTWTVRAPGDDDPSSAGGRRAVLERLLAEARDQGGVPTDDELASALGVSRRTVLRDMAALRGTDLPLTRGRSVVRPAG